MSHLNARVTNFVITVKYFHELHMPLVNIRKVIQIIIFVDMSDDSVLRNVWTQIQNPLERIIVGSDAK